MYYNYGNGEVIDWREHTAPNISLPAQFKQAGYRVFGAGKVFHGGTIFPEEWTDYSFSDEDLLNGRGGEQTDGLLKPRKAGLRDEDFHDYHVTNWCEDKISETGEGPFFLACGLYKPHLSFSVPDRFHERFAADQVALPPFRPDDHEDIPQVARQRMFYGDFQKTVLSGRWGEVVSNYLAAINYTDENIGRLIQKLRDTGQYDNTIIIVFGDHGWHLGEKGQFRKFTLWEEGTRTPFVWRVPGVTPAGSRVEAPVDLMSLYPTLIELLDLPRPDHVEGLSVTPLLSDPAAPWDQPALTTFGPGNNAVRMGPYRLIQYSDGSREFYDHESDPFEWDNLAGQADVAAMERELAQFLPTSQVDPVAKMTFKKPQGRIEKLLNRQVSLFNLIALGALLLALAVGAAGVWLFVRPAKN